MSDLDRIRDEGARSYYKYSGAFACPYPRNTPEFNAFEVGWSRELRKSDKPAYVPNQWPGPEQAPKRNEPERINEYARLKGRSRPRDAED